MSQPSLPPAPPLPPQIRVTETGRPAQPITTADVAALKARKTELSNQLISATERRKAVQEALRGATGADKAGLEQRLGVLDARIARLEGDIDQNSGQLASLEVTRLGSSSSAPWDGPSRPVGDYAMPISMVFIIFVMAPIAVSIARNIWKRGSRQAAAPANPDHVHRLERIEQAVDAIAIEVERVSEGQRFVTRLMSERAGEPAMQPLRAGEESLVQRR